jgi:adenine deaminase
MTRRAPLGASGYNATTLQVVCHDTTRFPPTLTQSLVAVAMGRQPADTVICNGRWVNVHSGEILPGTGRGHRRRAQWPTSARTRATASAPSTRIIEAKQRYLVPGLCDGHMHVESGMVTVTEFARAVIPHGTTSMFIDPHEIANVLGLRRRAADARRGGGAADQHLCRDAQLRAQPRPGWRRAGASHRPGRRGRGDGLAGHHRPGRDDELPRRRQPTERCWPRWPPRSAPARRSAATTPRPISAAPSTAYAAGRPGRRPRGHARQDAIARVRQGMRAMLRLGSAWYDVAAQIKADHRKGPRQPQLHPLHRRLPLRHAGPGRAHGPRRAPRHRPWARPDDGHPDGHAQHGDSISGWSASSAPSRRAAAPT